MSLRFAPFLSMLLVLGCRSHEEVCEGAECRESEGGSGGMSENGFGDGGDQAAAGSIAGTGAAAAVAGAAGTVATGEGGAAGGAGPTITGCSKDSQCDDGLACNGVESCNDGQCGPGKAAECESGTVCVEQQDDQLCVYETPSPWLVLVAEDRLLGLPTAELGKRDLLELGDLASQDGGSPLTDVFWSPDGRRALVEFEADKGEALHELFLDGGVPQPLHAVAELPALGDFTDVSYSLDGSRAIVSDEDSGAYWLDLTETRAKASAYGYSFADRYSDLSVGFCDDAETWIDLWASPPLRVTSAAAGLEKKSLGGDAAYVSPNGKWVFISGPDARLSPCLGGSQPVSFEISAYEAVWSPLSTHVLTVDDDGYRLFSIADPLAPEPLWSEPEAWPIGFSPDGTKLIVQLPHDDTETLAVLDLQPGKPVKPRNLLDDPWLLVEACGNAGCIAWRAWADLEGDDLIYVPFDPEKPVLPLVEGVAEIELDWSDCDRGLAVIEQGLESSAHRVSLLRFDAGVVTEQPLFDSDADSGQVTVASDRSGVAVRTITGDEVENVWVRFPAVGVKPVVVPLAAGTVAYTTTFQPWP